MLHEYGGYSNESGRADPSKFMELKGRKSLFTLLQETWAAFFDSTGKPVYRNPGNAEGDWNWRRPIAQSNEYFGGDNQNEKSYDYKYMSEQGLVIDCGGWEDMSGKSLRESLGILKKMV